MFKQLAFLTTFIVNLAYGMNCTEFHSFKSYGGHYYTITHDKLTFTNAQTYAVQNGGYLAIPNNSDENTFISNIISRDAAWIGIHDPAFIQNQCNLDTGSCISSDNRFRTVKGDALSYNNWSAGEPNNAIYDSDFNNGTALVAPTGEFWVVMGAAGQWADAGNHIKGNAETVRFQALFEFDTMPSCATPPTDNTDPINNMGAGGQAICDTKIYNNELNITIPHQTFDCITTEEGDTYCPHLLAECGQEWDYFPSTATQHQGTILCDTTMPGSTLQNGVCVGQPACTQGSFDPATGKCKIADTKMTCNGKWQNFGMEDYIWMKKWTPTGKIHDYKYEICDWVGTNCKVKKRWKFYTGLRYKCSSSSSVRFEQMHKVTGSTNSTIWSLIFESLDMRDAENNINFDTGRKRSPQESWADAKYYIPQTYADEGGTSNWAARIHMDGIYNQIKRVGTRLFFRVENTYDGAGWDVRDKVEGYSPLYQESFTAVTCPSSMTGVNSAGRCYANAQTYTYYEYLCNLGGGVVDEGGDCGGTPLVDTNNDGVGDSCNSPNPPTENCKKEKYICKSDEDRPCVKVDNKMQCSPFPCFGSGDIEDLDTPTGINDKNNDGWTSAGDCAGQIYIFNGQDNRCRSKMAFGLVNDCCSHDAFLFSLIECKDYEQILDRKKEDKRCHLVGEYCSDKVLGACVQKKKTFCCFNSKLARIIVEEGREQVKDLNWGTEKSPNCRGFTPEEFEKIDFSRIDLTEFTDDLQNQIDVTNIQNTTDRLKDKINNMQRTTGETNS